MNSKSFLDGKDDNLLISLSIKPKLSVNDKEVKIKTTGSSYQLFYNPKKINNLKITVTRDNYSAFLSFPEQLWSE